MLSAIGAGLVAACGGGTTEPFPSPTPVPAAVQTSVPVTIATSGPGPAVSMMLPAPAGYSTRITIATASASPGTTVSVTSSVTRPSFLPVLDVAGSRRPPASVTARAREAANDPGDPYLFTGLMPGSYHVGVSGDVTLVQSFPPGVLSALSSYDLAFYDGTQPAPAWQTIAGPVTSTDGVAITFSASVSSFAFQAGGVYGFAIFAPGFGQ